MQIRTDAQVTKRQLVILSFCADGYSREEIGRKLFLSPETVKKDLDFLREELGARNVTHALAICIVAGHLVVRDDCVEAPENALAVAA